MNRILFSLSAVADRLEAADGNVEALPAAPARRKRHGYRVLLRLTAAAAAAAGALVATAASAAPAITGSWITPRGATVELQPCAGDALCGTLISSPAIRSDPAARDARNANAALRTRKLSRLVILSGLKAAGSGWSGGRIYNPDDGKTYGASMEMMPSGMVRVKGCLPPVLGMSFCGLQQWKRAM